MPRQKMNRIEALRVLGLKPGATPEDIKRAFHRLAAEYHPDKHASAPLAERQAAELRMQQINEARRILTEEPKPPSFVDMLKRMNPDFNSAKSTVKPQEPQKHATRTSSKQDGREKKLWHEMQKVMARDLKQATGEETAFVKLFHDLYLRHNLLADTKGFLQYAKRINELPGENEKKHLAFDFFVEVYISRKMHFSGALIYFPTKSDNIVFSAADICSIVEELSKAGKQDSIEHFKAVLATMAAFESGLSVEPAGSAQRVLYKRFSTFDEKTLANLKEYAILLHKKNLSPADPEAIASILDVVFSLSPDVKEIIRITEYYPTRVVTDSPEHYLTDLQHLFSHKEILDSVSKKVDVVLKHVLKASREAELDVYYKRSLLLKLLFVRTDGLEETAATLADHSLILREEDVQRRLNVIIDFNNAIVSNGIPPKAVRTFLDSMKTNMIHPRAAIPIAVAFFEKVKEIGADPLQEAKCFVKFRTEKAISQDPWWTDELKAAHLQAWLGNDFEKNMGMLIDVYFKSANVRAQMVARLAESAQRRKQTYKQKKKRKATSRDGILVSPKQRRLKISIPEKKEDYLNFFKLLRANGCIAYESNNYDGFADIVVAMPYGREKKMAAFSFFAESKMKMHDADTICQAVDALCGAKPNDSEAHFQAVLEVLKPFKLLSFSLEDCKRLEEAYRYLSEFDDQTLGRVAVYCKKFANRAAAIGIDLRIDTYEDIRSVIDAIIKADRKDKSLLARTLKQCNNTVKYRPLFFSWNSIAQSLPTMLSRPRDINAALQLSERLCLPYRLSKGVRQQTDEIKSAIFCSALSFDGDVEAFTRFAIAVAQPLSHTAFATVYIEHERAKQAGHKQVDPSLEAAVMIRRYAAIEQLYRELAPQGVPAKDIKMFFELMSSTSSYLNIKVPMDDAVKHAIAFFRKCKEHDFNYHEAITSFRVFITKTNKSKPTWQTQELERACAALRYPEKAGASVSVLMEAFFSMPEVYKTISLELRNTLKKRSASRAKTMAQKRKNKEG